MVNINCAGVRVTPEAICALRAQGLAEAFWAAQGSDWSHENWLQLPDGFTLSGLASPEACNPRTLRFSEK